MEILAFALKKRAHSRSKRAREKKYFPSHSGILKAMHSIVVGRRNEMTRRVFMGKVIVGATMSLDWFMNDRNGDVSRLYPDLEALRSTEMLEEEIRTTGAVVMGRRAYDMAEGDLTDYEYQVPIFVLTHHIPEKAAKGVNDQLTLTFVTDGIESALEKAKAAAGDKHVMVIGGAITAQQCLRAGLVNEIHIGIVPVLLGEGLRFFEPLDNEQMELERTRVFESPTRTDLWFRVVK
jgi:dihydrofolate reductase